MSFFAIAIIGFLSFSARNNGSADNADPGESCWSELREAILAGRPNIENHVEIQTNVFRDDDDCIAAGETVMVVTGLPLVSGVYESRGGASGVEGWSLDDRARFEPIGRCFVDPVHVFTTKIVHADFDVDDQRQDDNDGSVGSQYSVLTTVQVGMSGEGGPFAAVVREESFIQDDDSTIAASVVSHNYEPTQDVNVDYGIWDEETLTGIATFTSRSYNNREYLPWTDAEWPGTPNYAFTITLVCK